MNVHKALEAIGACALAGAAGVWAYRLFLRHQRRSSEAVLTYFAGHGRGEEVRLMLAVCGVPWRDEVLGATDGATHMCTPEHQLQLMRAGVLAMDQTPLLVIDGLHLVQKPAILRYLARRHGLYGSSEEERSKIDILSDSVTDWDPVISIASVILGKKTMDEIAAHAARYLNRFDRALRANTGTGPFLVGTSLSFADIQLFQGLEQLSKQRVVDLERDWPALHAYCRRVRSVRGIAAYLASGRQLEFPGEGGADHYYATARKVLPWILTDAQYPGMLSREWRFRTS